MNTDEARYFLAICDEGSVSQAASSLYISPQGLSRSLKRFEAKLGVRLFVRTPQGMVPTEQALRLKEHLRKMVDAEDEAYRYLAELKRADRVRYLLGRDSMLGDTVIEGVEDYNRRQGKEAVKAVMMRESEDRLARIFVEGGYDYRFLSAELNDLQELPCEEICTLRFVPLVNCESPVAQRGSLAFPDLRELTVLAEYRSFAWVKILERICQGLGFEPRIREVDKDYIARLLSRPGDEVVYVRQLDLEHAPWTSESFRVPASFDALDAHIVLQSMGSRIDPDLVECLRSRFAESPYAAASCSDAGQTRSE